MKKRTSRQVQHQPPITLSDRQQQAEISPILLANPGAVLAFDLLTCAETYRKFALAKIYLPLKSELLAAADMLDDFADQVPRLDPKLLEKFAATLPIEPTLFRLSGGLFNSMVGVIDLLQPQTLEDLCLIYFRAVEIALRDERWSDPPADKYEFFEFMDKFWKEFPKTDQ